MRQPRTVADVVAVSGRLGLGTATLGNLHREMGDEQAWQILEAAWGCGVRHFDTAPHYGLGLAERRLGAFLRTRPREEYTVSTKVGRLLRPDPAGSGEADTEGFAVSATLRRVWDLSPDGLRRSLEESLARLGLDRVDVAYVHDPERARPTAVIHDVVGGLARLRDVVAEVGVASMTTRTLADHAATGALDVVMVAGRHTLLDDSAAVEVFPHCRRYGIRVVAAAVFNSGLLSDATPGAGSLFDYAPAPADVLARARRIGEVCHETGVPMTTAALQWPLRDPLVSHVVVGVDRPAQVEANAAALDDAVPDAAWARLAALA